MMANRLTNLTNNAKYRDKQTLGKLIKIKNKIGINNDTDVVRYCINKVYDETKNC